MSISIKTPEDIAGLRIAGRLAAELLDYLTPFVKPGVSTGELDRLAYDYTVNVQGCIPACLGYCPPGMTPYPATSCISINHVVCHGIPSDKKILKAGDIVNIDVTSIKNGYHGDTSRMFVVGKPTIAGKRLVDLAFGTMWAGIDAVRPGGCFNDIGRACQAYADANGISVVRDYGGHGIGKGFHCAVACQVALTGHPFLALLAAMAAGVCSGFVTAFLQTRLGVESIMAGIIVNTGLYTINLAVMGFSSTMSLVKTETVFSIAKRALSFTGGWYKLVLAAAVIALAGAAMVALSRHPPRPVHPRHRRQRRRWCGPPASTRPLPSRWACASPAP